MYKSQCRNIRNMKNQGNNNQQPSMNNNSTIMYSNDNEVDEISDKE
jgi:hypothetical protein